VVVRCTKKMLDLLGGRNLALGDPAPTDDDWYLNLLWIERQKCLLLTHSGTLFSIFRAGVRVADLRPLGDYLIDALATELATEGFPADALSHFDRNDVRISKTASRRTLGYMNEMASELEWHIARDGGLDQADINELNPRAPPHAPQPRRQRLRPPDRTRQPTPRSTRTTTHQYLNPTGSRY
jgi:hypothetical protein